MNKRNCDTQEPLDDLVLQLGGSALPSNTTNSTYGLLCCDDRKENCPYLLLKKNGDLATANYEPMCLYRGE